MTERIDATGVEGRLVGGGRPEDRPGDGGLVQDRKRAHAPHAGRGADRASGLRASVIRGTAPPAQANRRKRGSPKMVKGDGGAFALEVPRDRGGSFAPRLAAQGQALIDGKIAAVHARGMSVRDIRGHLEALYGLEVSPGVISRVTDAGLDAALDAVDPVVISDAAAGEVPRRGQPDREERGGLPRASGSRPRAGARRSASGSPRTQGRRSGRVSGPRSGTAGGRGGPTS